MVLNLRQPDRRRFKSPLKETRRRKREYYYSAVSVLVVKLVLLVFLCILLSVTSRVFLYRFSDKPAILKLAVPALVLMSIIVLVYYIIKNIKDLRALSKELHQPGSRER